MISRISNFPITAWLRRDAMTSSCSRRFPGQVQPDEAKLDLQFIQFNAEPHHLFRSS